MNYKFRSFTIEELTKQIMNIGAFLPDESIQDILFTKDGHYYNRTSEERNEQMDKIIENYYL